MEHRTVLNHCEVVNGIKYTIPQTEDEYQNCLDFYCKYFLPREPMFVALGGKTESPSPPVESQFVEAIRQNSSVMAMDSVSGQLVGIRISEVKEKVKSDQAEPSFKRYQSTYPEIHAIIFYTIDKYIKNWNCFDAFKDLDRVYYMHYLSTHPQWGGKGIAKQLLAQSFKIAKKLRCQGAQVVASNDVTIQIFRKMGMTALQVVPWDDIEVDGKKPYTKAHSEAMINFFLKFD